MRYFTCNSRFVPNKHLFYDYTGNCINTKVRISILKITVSLSYKYVCVCVTAEKKVHSVGEIKRKFYYSFLLIAPYKASES